MQVPLEIAARNLTVSEELETKIREYADRLELRHPQLTSCRVALDRPQAGRRTGSPVRVRLDLRAGGLSLTIRRRTGPTPLAAAQAAFDAAMRRLDEAAGRQRESRRQPRVQPTRGRITEIQPLAGYGFLESHDGRRIYFDARSVLNDAFDRLTVGTEVRFAEEEGHDGPQASTVAI